MSELVRLRRRVRVLFLACIASGALGIYGWVSSRPAARAAARSGGDLEGFRQRIARVGRTQRIRMLQRVVRGGGERAVARVIEMFRGAKSDALRRAAIEQLGRLGGTKAARELAAIVDDDPRLAHIAIPALGQCACSDATAALLSLLESPQAPSLRAATVAALGELGDSVAVDELLVLAADPSEPARSSAVAALGRSGSAKAVALLTRLSQDPSLQSAAIGALGRLGLPAVQKTLIALARRGDVATRVAAVEALGNYTDPEVQVLLASLARSKSPRVAGMALKVLGESVTPLARRALREAATSADPRLRLEAARALAKAGDPAAQGTLISLVGKGREGASAAQALAKLGTPAARDALLGLAREGASTSAQAQAVTALRELGGEDVEATLDQLRRTAPPSVAAAALGQLAQRRGKEALPMLEEALQGGSLALRRSALAAMSKLKGPKVQRLLIETASSTSDYQLRAEAVQGLTRLATPDAKAALVSMFERGDENLRNEVSRALGTLGGDAARKVLLAALEKGEGFYGVRTALARFHDPVTRRRLHELLDDPSVKEKTKSQVLQTLAARGDKASLLSMAQGHVAPELRRVALRELARLGGPGAEQSLTDALVSASDGDTKCEALRGLAKLGTPSAIGAVVRSLDDPETLRTAARVLAKDGRKAAAMGIEAIYYSSDVEERRMLVYAVGSQVESSPLSQRFLFRSLNDDDERVVLASANKLVLGGGMSGHEHLYRKMLASHRPRVRHYIARILRSIKTGVYTAHREEIDAIDRGE